MRAQVWAPPANTEANATLARTADGDASSDARARTGSVEGFDSGLPGSWHPRSSATAAEPNPSIPILVLMRPPDEEPAHRRGGSGSTPIARRQGRVLRKGVTRIREPTSGYFQGCLTEMR